MKTETMCRDMLCDGCIAERPRYFPRQLITPSEMTLEQDYFRNKLRRHNRLLHGWGVVCGALVCPMPKADGNGFEPWKVVVKSGYILGPYGDEIMIDCDRIFDLRTACLTGVTAEPCGERVDPWCSEVFVPRKPTDKLYVAVKYKEFMTRPVRIQPVGCSCDETQCEYSRLCDGYEICVLTCCPDSHKNPPNLDDLFKGPNPECPPCPAEPWVVLAEVEVDENGTVEKIDNCSCRRIVISFGHFWWKCKVVSCEIDSVKGGEERKQGTRDIEIVVTGKNFQPGATVDLGSGVNIVGDVTVEEGKTKLKFKVDVAKDALVGPRTLTILNPDCTLCREESAIVIKEEKKLAHAPAPEKPKAPAAPRRERKK